MLRNYNTSGTLSPTPEPIYFTQNNQSTVVNIKCTPIPDSGDYVVALYLQRKGADKILLYQFSLEEGDMVNDDTVYQLQKGDQLLASASVGSVNYSISAQEESAL